MEKILALCTGVVHQVFLINKLRDQGFPICAVICEPPIGRPSFNTNFLYPKDRELFEAQALFLNTAREINGIPVYHVDNINGEEAVTIIREIGASVGIVFGTRKLKPAIIDLFDDFILNVHRGMAREYRGLNSDLWAIYHRDFENIGVTIHRVDVELDTGPYAFMEALPIPRDTKIWQLRALTTILATELLSKALQDHQKGQLVFHPQIKQGRYYSFFPTIFLESCTRRFHHYTSTL
jgi:methionyl-tRNA formyltransferase